MLELSGLCVRRDGRLVVDGACLAVSAGQALALLGPSGCGKSSLLWAIAGLLPIDTGIVAIAGAPVQAEPPERRGIGMVFQTAALWPHLTVREHLALPLSAARAEELLETLGLTALADRLPRQLSGGEARRVALGRALAPRPRVLLLDEPLAGVDALAAPELLDAVSAARAAGAAVIYVTHDPREAREACDAAAVMDAGRIVQCAPFAALAAKPATPLVKRFAALLEDRR